MTKQQKFLLFVQTILAARQIEENEAVRVLSQAFNVTEKDLNGRNSFDELRSADDFIDWMGCDEPFKDLPKWLSKETVSKILVG